jgi:hypothetical protein
MYHHQTVEPYFGQTCPELDTWWGEYPDYEEGLCLIVDGNPVDIFVRES